MTEQQKRIVGGLRYCEYEVPCEGCPWNAGHEDTCNDMRDLMKVAADTIESQDKDNDQLCSLRDNLCARIDLLVESLQKTQQLLDEVTRERDAQKWIRVTDELPRIGQAVLIRHNYNTNNGDHGEYDATTIGYYHPAKMKNGTPYGYFYYVGISDYGDMVRASSICPGDEHVTHWQPLPEPPKEGIHD